MCKGMNTDAHQPIQLSAPRFVVSALSGMRSGRTYTWQPFHRMIHVDWNVSVMVRDGTVLRVNVFRPKEGPGRFPVLMSAHPYGKDKIPCEDPQRARRSAAVAAPAAAAYS